MSSLASVINTKVRVHLQEATENEFSDANQLYPYIDQGHRFVAAQLSDIEESGWFEKTSTVTVSASSESAVLPTDFLRAVLVEWIDSSSIAHDLRPIPRSKITQSRTVSTVAGDVLPAYWLVQNTIHLLPVSGVARTLHLTHTYEPAAITIGGDTLETPTRYDHVVALYAAIKALADDGRADQVWNTMLQGFAAEMVQRETSRRDRGHGQSVEMVYTSDQY